MLKNFNVDIYNKAEGTKVGGIYIPGVLTFIKSIDCDIQPYSTALLLKDYGYNITVNKRIFLDFDINIKIGTVFYYINKQNILEKYEVKTLINWGYLEAMCLGV